LSKKLPFLLLVCCICFFIVAGFTEQPHKKDRNYYETRGEVVWEVPMNEKLIAFTFDDGPDPKSTPQILDLLNKYQAKATFFVIGNRIDRFPEVVQREAAEGHEVANHTYNHIYFTRKINSSTISNEIVNTKKKITDVTGKTCRWFRPPGGFYDETIVNIARQNGYTVILWSWHQDTRDWSSPGVKKIVNKVLDNARNGDIVLLHDNVRGSTQTIQALEKILPELSKRGFRMVTLSELMEHKKSKAFRELH
jgi:polysaccharide deacetylase family sporulation protein PdaB